MSPRISLVAALPVLFLAGAAPDAATQRSPMPVYVTPFYDSKGPTVSVGERGKALAGADSHTIVAICDELAKDRDALRPEVMYVAAIRLYDLGHKDEAVYWFYSAQYRARLFRGIIDQTNIGGTGSESFELPPAYASFAQLAGEYINGYAFGDIAKLADTLAKVRDQGRSLPKFGELFPKVAFVNETKWPEQNKQVSDGLAGFIDYVKANSDAIKQKRRETGVESRY